MRRMWRNLFVVFALGILLMLLAPAVPAQENQTWKDGCDARVVDAIAATSDMIDYQAACDHYRTCDPSGDGDALCQFSTFRMMQAQCPAEDKQCHDGAVLFAAAILAYDTPFGEVLGWEPPQTVIDGVPLGLEAFWNGDDAGALAAYQRTDPHDFYYDVMMPLSRAVLYQRLDLPEQAFAEYDYAFGFVFGHPLIYYARSRLYAELGRLDEASFDVAALAAYISRDPEFNDPALDEFLTALQAEYPLDETRLQDWLYYPVSATSQYVTDAAYDTSLKEPRPVRVGVFEDLNAVVAIGLKNWDESCINSSDEILQVLRGSDDRTTYTLTYPTFDDNAGAISLTRVDSGYTGNEYIYYFEGAASWDFMLAPADAPDPRHSLNERRYCEAGVVSRVEIGTVVTNISYAGTYPLQLTDTPDGEVMAEITEPHTGYITVVGGPTCVQGVTWWEGYHTSGVRGWFPENIDTLYNATPTAMQPDIPFCAGNAPSLSPRLSVGQNALVIADLGANNIRSEPSAEAELLGRIPPDNTFEVIGGPVCLDDIVWWYVDYAGLRGWTAEGEAPTYWLAPVE